MTAALIYIHGFISSPQSHKAQQLARYVAEHHPDISYFVPSLANTPGEAAQQLDELVQHCLQHHAGSVGLIGSSLGGFLATVLAERYSLPAVLINPAVEPHNFAGHFLGAHHNPYTGVDFSLNQADIDQLRSMVSAPVKGRYWVLVQEGDEVLDYRLALEFYKGCDITVETGGDHSFQQFERHLPAVVDFYAWGSGL
ncbi:MAG: esterase YqiA [Zhongshania sp.]|uniref:YqiA/YcfP family alpha/beta fold hydrolase n=1 Tax=Zhongshania sp. TaxID=1971902 RepID=UPI0026228763|nr:YqiA/YcfP family alpha/beta fold hydrolase [Zhongshania sp.]MDF1692609.1 esterase YqiA [Zhongshania sp.]